MFYYTLKRLGLAVLVAITVSVVSFFLLRATGDPAAALAGENASDKEIQFIREKYGFDRPLIVQYLSWGQMAIRGDLGESPYFNLPVTQVIGDRIGTTMILGGCALAFALLLAIPLGVLAAIRPNTWWDRGALTIAVVGQAMPAFWFGLIMIIVFSVWLRWLPVSGSDSWKHFIMPTVAIGYYATPAFMRLTRAGMLEVLSSDYIRTARAKGIKPLKVFFKHALRNAIIPVVSLAAVQFGFMLGGSIVIESVFAINGLGFLAWESIGRLDLPVIQAIVLLFSLIYVALTFFSDLLNAALDPRIRVK
jgi:peptide/nickel transport system permease protein